MSCVLRIRHWLGCWAGERISTELVLAETKICNSSAWGKISNRNEKVVSGSDPDAIVCKWTDSSWLTVAKVFPNVGARLLHTSWAHFAVEFSLPENSSCNIANHLVSVIIPLCGQDRLDQARQVIESFQQPENQVSEIIVVGPTADLSSLDQSGANVRRIGLENKDNVDGFNKSAALNIGAQHAPGRPRAMLGP